MRSLLILGIAMIFTGCAQMPRSTDVTQLQMTARDNGAVYYGSARREFLRVTSLTLEVDRRIYNGNIELTDPNASFGLYQIYGARNAAPKSADTLRGTNFRSAILSSTDKLTIKCDFVDYRGTDTHGICIDQSQRVFDAVLNVGPNERYDDIVPAERK